MCAFAGGCGWLSRSSRRGWRPRVSRVGAIAVAGCLAAALSACGSSGSNTDSTGTSAKTSGSPIKVMTIGPWNNPELDAEDYALAGVDSAAYINAHGGVNGRPIDVVICNDSLSQAGAEACAREAVSDHVVALVGGLSIFDGAILPIISAAGIPWIGSDPFQALAYSSPDSFPFNAGELDRTVIAYTAGESCARTVLIDAGQGSAADVPFEEAGMKAAGKSFVAHISLSAAAPDYSVFAAQAKAADPDCLVLDINNVELQLLIPALQQSNVEMTKVYSTCDNYTAPNIAGPFQKVIQGWECGNFTTSYWSAPWATYRQVVAQYKLATQAANAKPNGSVDVNDWLAYNVFKTVVSGIKGDITGATITAAFDKAGNIDTNGLAPPLNFTKKAASTAFARIVNPYIYMMKIENGQTEQVGQPQDALSLYERASS
jgi:branched-chain amino acid transport system substrate-binding protein